MADTFASEAVKFIERHRERPFFLYFALHDPHVPRVPHPRFVGETSMGPRGDAIVQADWCVGEVLATLDRLKLAENTLVVFSSDNGPVVDDGYQDDAVEKLGDHRPAGPLRGGKYSKFEAGTRVPFIVRWPGKGETRSERRPGLPDRPVGQPGRADSSAAGRRRWAGQFEHAVGAAWANRPWGANMSWNKVPEASPCAWETGSTLSRLRAHRAIATRTPRPATRPRRSCTNCATTRPSKTIWLPAKPTRSASCNRSSIRFAWGGRGVTESSSSFVRAMPMASATIAAINAARASRSHAQPATVAAAPCGRWRSPVRSRPVRKAPRSGRIPRPTHARESLAA